MKQLILFCVVLAVALSTSATAGPIGWSGVQDLPFGAGGAWHDDYPAISDYNLDVDGNGANDFYLGGMRPNFVVNPIDNDNLFLCTWTTVYGQEGWWWPPLDYGATIDPVPGPSQTWLEPDAYITLAAWFPSPGIWNGAMEGGTEYVATENGYLGFSFEADTGTHYGWMRISTSGDDLQGATLHDWAWNTTPGQGLWAGQVPEPSTYILFALGGLTIAIAARRRIRKQE